MRYTNRDELYASLRSAWDGKVCNEVWLGHANVLFMGTGDDVVVPPGAVRDKRRQVASFLLQTDWADWRITRDGEVVTHADDDAADDAIEVLYGQRIVHWVVGEPVPTLDIFFENNISLNITPMAGTDRDMSQYEGWRLRIGDEYYCVRWDGVLWVKHKDEKCSVKPG